MARTLLKIAFIPAEEGLKFLATLDAYFNQLEIRLADNEFVAGKRFTLADITNMCAVDFAARVELAIPAGNENTKRWYETCHARPSAAV